ncbi:hypothetical protein BDZ45DRAFT_745792 [Acephala macrosclerotiorum]|nr:hypothetical protein BDZ45DRAFT_745792 [Acephala macrosclerotiorum]
MEYLIGDGIPEITESFLTDCKRRFAKAEEIYLKDNSDSRCPGLAQLSNYRREQRKWAKLDDARMSRAIEQEEDKSKHKAEGDEKDKAEEEEEEEWVPIEKWWSKHSNSKE